MKPLDGFFSVRSSMELSSLVVVQRHGHLHYMGFPGSPGKCILLKTLDGFSPFVILQRHEGYLPIAPIWALPCAEMHIALATGWFFAIRNSVELSKPYSSR